jgi:hypothetical protein
MLFLPTLYIAAGIAPADLRLCEGAEIKDVDAEHKEGRGEKWQGCG